MKNTSSWLRASSILLLALTGTGSLLADQPVLYGVSFFNNELIKINSVDGSGSLLATLSEPVSPYGIAFRGDRLYTFDAGSDRIREINKDTGFVSGSFDVGVGDLVGEGDLAFRSDGIGFLSSALTPDFKVANDLFRFDLTTGTSVRVGTTDVVLDGMVFSGNTLYGIGQEADAKLYIVDQNTAALTMVGSLGVVNNSPFAALTISSNGALFGAINDQLYSIDKLTGTASALDPTVLDIGYGSVSGLAFSSPASSNVPEPATYELQFAAVLLLGHFVRRKWMQSKASSLTA